MTNRERILLALTVVGFVVPNVMFGTFIAREGLDMGQFIGDLFRTLPAAQITVDLLIVAVTFLLWATWESSRPRIEYWWLVFPATFLVGLRFAAPLFLLLRERALRAQAAA